jgi:hypothetical protein
MSPGFREWTSSCIKEIDCFPSLFFNGYLSIRNEAIETMEATEFREAKFPSETEGAIGLVSSY